MTKVTDDLVYESLVKPWITTTKNTYADHTGEVGAKTESSCEKSMWICSTQVSSFANSLICMWAFGRHPYEQLSSFHLSTHQLAPQCMQCLCRSILAVVGPPDSGKSALVAAMCGRLYKPAKMTGQIVISGRETYEAFRPTWFSAIDVLTSHLTVHQYLVYKGKHTCQSSNSPHARCVCTSPSVCCCLHSGKCWCLLAGQLF